MGRDKSDKYRKDLHQQAYDKLTSMQAFGQSKKAAKAAGTDRDKIFSKSTYDTYWKHIKYFIHYVQTEHPECRTMKKARKYVNEWLQSRADQVNKKGEHLSAWTIQTEAKALGKLYDINPADDDYFVPPVRKRENIKRSRGNKVRDKHFSVTNNDELIKFCRGVGLRREGVSHIKGNCLYTRERIEAMIVSLETKKKNTGVLTEKENLQLEALQNTRCFTKEDHFIRVKEKGGKIRYAPIVGPDKQQIIERIKATPEDKYVWQHVSSNADIHSYRDDYARYIYREYARDIKDIPYDRINKGSGRRYQGDLYICRKDEKDKKLDRRAMLIVSKALGHNRQDVTAEHYIMGL